MPAKRRAMPTVEFESDAWSRFERAVDVVAKSPPQHRVKAPPKRHDEMKVGKRPKLERKKRKPKGVKKSA